MAVHRMDIERHSARTVHRLERAPTLPRPAKVRLRQWLTRNWEPLEAPKPANVLLLHRLVELKTDGV